MTDADPIASRVLATLTERGLTLAIAESLTGGLLTAAIVDVPGAATALRGGIVAYDTRVKHTLLGVDADLLASAGAVDPRVAIAMARGVRAATALDTATSIGLATTGVAGPDAQDGKPPGTVHLGISTDAGDSARSLVLSGGRAEIRRAAVAAALQLLADTLGS
ncbi:MAG: nicotinamide-nucleotide amidohydrolase family protein [Microbacterium sp.]|nr:nicotinamide-nucleotide amidohydrolase family protein [Microbacterium sp.]